MHITVDGVPIDDPGRSSADVQRCTDVALDKAAIRFQFDNLKARRRLSVAVAPSVDPVTTTLQALPLFFLYEGSILLCALLDRRERRLNTSPALET